MKEELILLIKTLMSESSERFLLGICGAPGAGKSTLAEWIVAEWNNQSPDKAVLVPMDGYHYSNEKLEDLKLKHLKGIPETFDSDAFVSKISSIRQSPQKAHACPRFDRSIEASIQDAIAVLPEHKLVVVEGNYLLLDRSPWHRLKDLFNEIWLIDADEELILPRLISRHRLSGKSEAAAIEKVDSTDLPNARLISAFKNRAHRIFNAANLQDK